MKSFFVGCMWFLFSANLMSAQIKEARIQEIKKMYTEVNALQTNQAKGACNEATKTEYDSFDKNSEKIPFEQTASSCKFSNVYSTYHGKFLGYEWGEDITFYMKNGKVFFVLMTNGAEACANEYRVYYDMKGSPIRVLHRFNDCNGDTPVEKGEMPEGADKKQVLADIKTDLKKIIAILK